MTSNFWQSVWTFVKVKSKIYFYFTEVLLKSIPWWLTSAKLHHWGHTISACSWNERSTDIWLVNTYTRLLACSSSNSTDSNAMKSIRSGMSYLVSYLSFIFFLKSSFSLSVLIGGGFGKGVLFSASLSSSFRRACSLGAPVNIFNINIFANFWTLFLCLRYC